MPSSRDIKRRIKSVTNTKQIIKAMELVSVVKMQKAVDSNLASRVYSNSAKDIIENVYHAFKKKDHPFLSSSKNNKKSLVLLITSNRGLAGSLNIKTIKKAIDLYEKNSRDSAVDFVTIGKKGRDFLKSYKYPVIAEFVDIDDGLNFKNIFPVIHLLVAEFKKGNYGKVEVIYPHFQSTLSQEAKRVKLLPMEIEKKEGPEDYIIFEPFKKAIIDNLIPRILEIELWQIILESKASEHSARMVAMKNANENAGSLIDDLTVSFNQNRQAAITREIAEISAGKLTQEG